MTYKEVNFDGLISPAHNYAGLALGNLASKNNQGSVSNPREGALQGLAKMRSVMELGLVQGFLPPQDRPALHILRALGFSGTDTKIINDAARDNAGLLANIYSASSMWCANAATIAPSLDTPDGKVHFLPANLASHFHRTIEAQTTADILRHIFADEKLFAHHVPLPGGVHFGDEGAANHGRLCEEHNSKGLHLFVYGVNGDKYPARQRLEASQSAARCFGLGAEDAVFIQQSKAALDAGAFHNDVVGVANENVLFLHEQSFENQKEVLQNLQLKMPQLSIIEAPTQQVSLDDAISSYIFNSQLITLPTRGPTGGPTGSMGLVLPSEAQENQRVHDYLQSVVEGDNPVSQLIFKNVRESMRNGGGPACLRLRVLLSEQELAGTNQNFILTPPLIDKLENWVNEHYRDQLHPDDLRDPAFAMECLTALDALTQLLDMGAFYRFQR